jgi:hypothetical protein
MLYRAVKYGCFLGVYSVGPGVLSWTLEDKIYLGIDIPFLSLKDLSMSLLIEYAEGEGMICFDFYSGNYIFLVSFGNDGALYFL